MKKRKHTKRRTRPAKGMPTPASQRRRANKNRVHEKSVAVLGAVETLLQHGHTAPALSVLIDVLKIDVLKYPVELEEFSKSMVRMPQ